MQQISPDEAAMWLSPCIGVRKPNAICPWWRRIRQLLWELVHCCQLQSVILASCSRSGALGGLGQMCAKEEHRDNFQGTTFQGTASSIYLCTGKLSHCCV